MTKQLRFLLLAAAFAVPFAAFAQWQWIDKDGRKVFSDQAPPADVPAKNILKRPGPGGKGAQPAEPDPAASAAAAPKPPAPKPTGKDRELEEKKKQAEAADAEKRKAQEEELSRTRADNCTRARQSKAALDSGVRISRMNEKGEREFLDDAQRAAEGKRLDGLIARECRAPAQ